MQRQAYDPRLRNDVARTGNIHIFDNLEIPSSTMRTWRARGQVEFVTIEPDHAREADLRDRLERAERRLLIARAKIVLLTTRAGFGEASAPELLSFPEFQDCISIAKRPSIGRCSQPSLKE